MKPALLERTPPRSQILAIYGLIVMLIYGWSIYWFIWNIPSWIGFLTPLEILAMLSYTLSVNLFESLTILSGLLVLCIVLPQTWLRDDFIWRAASLVVLCLTYLMVTLARSTPLTSIPKYAFFSLVIFMIVQLISAKSVILQKITNELTERSVIFIYITIPLSLASIIFVILRNI